ncbi:hypothetical protein Tco_0173651 [Tanacetum coccineum]
MPTTRQGMSSAKIEQIITQQVTNAIEAIAIYDTKIHMAHDSIVRVVRQGANVARNANNKRKWEGSYQNTSGQQNKGQKVMRAYTVGPDNKNGYAGKLPLCDKCKLHHTGSCTRKCNKYKRVGHMTRDCRTPIPATTQIPLVANQKTVVTCHKCGNQRYFKSKCPRLKSQSRVNQKGKTHGDSDVIMDNAFT